MRHPKRPQEADMGMRATSIGIARGHAVERGRDSAPSALALALAVALGNAGCGPSAEPAGDAREGDASTYATTFPSLTTFEDYERALDELSNWGRWGPDDELGAANLITPAKRAAAAALVTEGITVSLAHDIIQEPGVDGNVILDRQVVNVGPTGASDRYQYSGTYHGTVHSHLDALDCHIMVEGRGYNGVTMEEIQAAGGCPRGSIHAHREGIVTRGILFDATLLPGLATAEGWVEPGTAIHASDLVALEEIQGVRVEPGDVILLYTGRWKRRAALGPWPTSEGVAGYHADVAYFLKDRGVSFIGHDMWNDAYPMEFAEQERLPLHRLALVSLGVSIFDNLDFERLAEVAREQGRYEFLFVAAPLRIEMGMGSPLNPVAVF
jgi:kynurenine formamidase